MFLVDLGLLKEFSAGSLRAEDPAGYLGDLGKPLVIFEARCGPIDLLEPLRLTKFLNDIITDK